MLRPHQPKGELSSPFGFYNQQAFFRNMGDTKTYTSEKIEISWNSKTCIHSAVCVKNLPGVFNLDKKPWINPEGAEVQEIKDLIHSCPSGALQYKVAGEEKPDEPEVAAGTEINLVKDGPLRLKGNFQIFDENGNAMEHKQVASLCRCGASKNKPFCDGTHKSIGFQA